VTARPRQQRVMQNPCPLCLPWFQAFFFFSLSDILHDGGGGEGSSYIEIEDILRAVSHGIVFMNIYMLAIINMACITKINLPCGSDKARRKYFRLSIMDFFTERKGLWQLAGAIFTVG